MRIRSIEDIITISILCICFISYINRKLKKPKSSKEYLKKIQQFYSYKKWLKTINLSLDALNKFQFNVEDEITIILAISNSQYELQNYSDTINYFNKAFDLVLSNHKKYQYTECFIYALDSLIRLKRIDEAKILFYKIIECNENKKEFKGLIKFAEKNNIV